MINKKEIDIIIKYIHQGTCVFKPLNYKVVQSGGWIIPFIYYVVSLSWTDKDMDEYKNNVNKDDYYKKWSGLINHLIKEKEIGIEAIRESKDPEMDREAVVRYEIIYGIYTDTIKHYLSAIDSYTDLVDTPSSSQEDISSEDDVMNMVYNVDTSPSQQALERKKALDKTLDNLLKHRQDMDRMIAQKILYHIRNHDFEIKEVGVEKNNGNYELMISLFTKIDSGDILDYKDFSSNDSQSYHIDRDMILTIYPHEKSTLGIGFNSVISHSKFKEILNYLAERIPPQIMNIIIRECQANLTHRKENIYKDIDTYRYKISKDQKVIDEMQHILADSFDMLHQLNSFMPTM